MWQFEHSIETRASAEAVWRLYRDVSTWPSWDEGIEAVELHGPFEPGAEGVLTPVGQEPLPFRVVEATPGRGFADETAAPGVVLRFIHRLLPLDGGGTRITHRVEIDGAAAEEVGAQAGPQITAGIPDTMESLARHALGKEAHA
ncbi:MAG: SRPBCC family protein [Thermoleophilaceae bacterium]